MVSYYLTAENNVIYLNQEENERNVQPLILNVVSLLIYPLTPASSLLMSKILSMAGLGVKGMILYINNITVSVIEPGFNN